MNCHILTLSAVVGVCLAGLHATAAGRVEPAEVREITRLLPAHAAGLGEPITNRAAWARLAALPGFARLVGEARDTARKPLPDSPDDLFLDFSKTGNRDRWQRVAGLRRGRLATFVLAEGLENRGRFVAPFEEALRAICAERTWVMPAHDGKLDNFQGRTVEMDLGATMLGWELATADFLLADKLPAPSRRLLRENLERRIFQPFRDMVEGRRQEIFWLTATHNWNAVCLAGVTGAALATLEPPEERAFFVAAARHYIKNFYLGFTPDGYCSEGLGYWNYGFGYYMMLAETLRQATGGGVDLLADPAARAPAFFGRRSEILNQVYPSIADCTPGTRPDQGVMSYLARRFNMPGAEVAQDGAPRPQRSLYAAALYAFLPPQLPAIPSAVAEPESRLRSWFPYGGVLICRPASAGAEFAVALKGGHNAEHHNHNDVGTFMVVAGRTMLLGDPGAEVYTARTFSGRRYDSDVLNSFGHPVPVIAGQLQRTGLAARAKVLRTDFTDARDLLALDLRSAYPVPALQRLERTFTYQRQGAPSLTVADRVEFDTAQTFETALVTWGRWERGGDRELLISDEGSAVRVRIETGGEPFEIKSKRLEADVHTPKHAERIGVALTFPVKAAQVTLVISPATAGGPAK